MTEQAGQDARAEAFVNKIIADAEHTRRRNRFTGGLPKESHEAHTNWRHIGEFTCQGCMAINRLDPPARPAEYDPCLVVCGQCGDATRVVYHVKSGGGI